MKVDFYSMPFGKLNESSKSKPSELSLAIQLPGVSQHIHPIHRIVQGIIILLHCLLHCLHKMFVKWKPCTKHILVCCGIASNQQNSKELANRSSMKAKKQGAQYRKVGKKKGLLHLPPEQDLVQAVEQHYDSLHNPVNRKHVLGHIRKLYGKGEFRRFGF